MPYSEAAWAHVSAAWEKGSNDDVCNPTVTFRIASCSIHHRKFIKQPNIEMLNDCVPIVSDDVTIDKKDFLNCTTEEEEPSSKISSFLAPLNTFGDAKTELGDRIVIVARRIASETSSSSSLIILKMTIITEYKWKGEVPLDLKYGRFEDFVGDDDNKFGEKICTICLDEFLNESQVKKMPCLHIFHSLCVDQWLRKSHHCPLCRSRLPVPPPSSDFSAEIISTISNYRFVSIF